MDIKINRYNKKYQAVSISGKINSILKNNYSSLKIPVNGLNVCFKDKNEIFTLYKNFNSDFCIIFDADLKESFVLFMVNFVITKNLKISSVFMILNIAELIGLSIEQFNKLFVHFNLPVYKKGFDYIKIFSGMSKTLVNLLDEQKVALKETMQFHSCFIKDYDGFLKIIPDNLTFSQKNELLKNITEYSKKENTNIEEIINKFKTINKNEILNYSRLLRNPLYYKYKDKISSFIEELNLPPGVKIEFDDKFETQNYKMLINFSDMDTLNGKLKKIEKALIKFKENDYKDKFDYKYLFEE